MSYTTDTVSHGTVRFATLPIDQWHVWLIAWNGGGLMLLNPLTGQWRMHKIGFGVDPNLTIDIRDCTIDGNPHQNLAASPGPVYNAYAYEDGAGNISVEFSLTREWITNGYIVKQGDPTRLLVGRLGCLPYGGGIGFPGGPRCAMCASFFQPETMSLKTDVGGSTSQPGVWVELVPFEQQIHFVCFGDGREPEIKFQGMVSNSAAGYNTYVGFSTRDVDPPWSEISGGTSPVPYAPTNATLIKSGAGMGDGVELYQRFGLKIRVEGGVGQIPLGGQIIASVMM